MTLLSKHHLRKIPQHPSLSIPHEAQFQLPDKILQFGTGVLLRGLPDYFVEKANREGLFNGRIVVVKSTENGDISSFKNQDYLYTLHIKGIKKGEIIHERVICSAISNILSVQSNWSDILKAAANPSIQIIISNTTEAGLQYVEEKLTAEPSGSFPGKLLQCLYHRYLTLRQLPNDKLIILPTELLSDNGEILKGIIEKLIRFNGLPPAFETWMEQRVIFCNTLVDRIVPGKLSDNELHRSVQQYGYRDDNAIMCEPYALWAIAGTDEVAELLSFSKLNEEVKIVPDISEFKELKLRILNGSHTLLCAKAIAEGFETVYQAMSHPIFKTFAAELIFDEILPALPPEIKTETKMVFAQDIIDRFSNGNIEHQWKSIALQYPTKLTIRVIPLFKNYIHFYGKTPEKMAICIKEIIRFLLLHEEIQIDDVSKAAIQQINSTTLSEDEKVNVLLKEEKVWGTNLSEWIKN
jgi:tagaturonate reductase